MNTTSLRLLGVVGIMQVGFPAAAQSNVTISGSLDIGVFRDTAGVRNVGTALANRATIADTAHALGVMGAADVQALLVPEKLTRPMRLEE